MKPTAKSPLCALAAKTAYGTALANVDWLHGSAESLLTITNLLIGRLFTRFVSTQCPDHPLRWGEISDCDAAAPRGWLLTSSFPPHFFLSSSFIAVIGLRQAIRQAAADKEVAESKAAAGAAAAIGEEQKTAAKD
jgi:hypothetical protein